ncbi:hypothetical protein [Candidatus Magnetobacterium casense]|uniref:VCBS repeat-containing protein n=1 Tax=Candidatus Magnetobacterium casense TaxID=1455061 RepID=A0ABS6RZD8_9BACT|nr:hypothetical protein [Candidatus Magnetobacterium casensis]MBV6341961.1 hypothetical protein [Candidatus Magnetobacterium casensis]
MVKKTVYGLILLLLLGSALASGNALAVDETLRPLVDKTVGFFKPLKQKVADVRGAVLTVDSSTAPEMFVKGMRLELFREAEMFYHPITNEPVGRFEKSVGVAEVTDVTPNAIKATVLSGKPQKDDTVRVSSSKLRLLFYQGKTIDWFVGDAYYRQLKETGRFDMLDTSLVTDDVEKLLAEAKKSYAGILAVVDGINEGRDKFLRQRLFWVSDAREISTDKLLLNEDYVSGLKSAADPFVASNDAPLLTYQLSTGYDLIALGDLDGDKQQEMLLNTGATVRVFKPTVDLHQLWTFDTDKFQDNIYLDTIDLNKNGKAEVIVTSYGSDGAYGYVYELKDNAIELLWKTKGFLRIIGGRLLFQAFDSSDGFKGDVFNVVYDGKYHPDKALMLPKGINIYDFAFLSDQGQGQDKELLRVVFYDDDNHMVISNDMGKILWRSKDDFGGFIREYQGDGFRRTGPWHVADKFYTTKHQALVIKRTPVTATVISLGYGKSKIVNLWWNGSTVDESALTGNLNGNILDYAIDKDRLYVLSKPILGIVAKNILSGDNPFVTVLSVYPFIY